MVPAVIVMYARYEKLSVFIINKKGNFCILRIILHKNFMTKLKEEYDSVN